MRIVYTLLLYFVYPVLYLKLKKRFGKGYIKERMNPELKGDFDIIIHAASVGEQVLIVPLVKELLKKSEKKILLTASTDTGLKKAKENFKGNENVYVCYFPFDFPGSLKRFFSNIRAKSLILVETELWPNAIFFAKKHKIKLYLVNGRISNSSYPHYRRFRSFLKSIFEMFERVMVRSDFDFKRFLEIGCPESKLKVCGNLKLLNKPETLVHIEIKTKLPVVVFGSTRDYEEDLILSEIKDLIGKKIAAIFVPRHIERVKELEQVVSEHGFNPVLSNNKNLLKLEEKDVLIVNETGKLVSYYAIADICFVGGSLVDFGGQNFVEPLFLGKPTVTGKFLSNFEDLKELLYNYFTIVENGRELRFFIENFFENKEYFVKRGLDAKRFLAESSVNLDCILGEII